MSVYRRRPVWAALAGLAVCGGCWEEIQYTPPAKTPVAAESDQREAPPSDAVVLDTPAEAPAAAPVVLEEPATAPPSDAPIKLP